MTLRTSLSALYWALQRAMRGMIGSALDERHFRRRSAQDVEHGATNLHHPHRAWLVDRLLGDGPGNPGTTRHFLEVGCGWGPNLWTLAERMPDAQLTGVDVSPASIALARKSARSFTASSVTLIEGEASHLARIPSRSVDIAFTDATLLYLGPDRIERCLLELIRISREKVVLLEMHFDGAGSGGHYTRDGWVRDYKELVRAVAPEAHIRFERLPADRRPVGRWPEYGALIQIDIRDRCSAA